MAGRVAKPKSQSDQIRDMNSPRKDDGTPKNNLQAIRDAEQAQLLSVLAKLRPLIADVEAAQAIVKTKREAVASMMDQAAAAGFKKGEVRELLKETAVTGQRKDLREAEERRLRFRRYLGLPVGETDDLPELPDGAKDEQDWRGSGYAAGLRGDACDPKGAGVPPRFHQIWMEEWGNGQSKLVMAMGGTPKLAPTPKGQTALEAIAEAEPEIVASVKADHEGFEMSEDELAGQSGRPQPDTDEAV